MTPGLNGRWRYFTQVSVQRLSDNGDTLNKQGWNGLRWSPAWM